MSEREFLKMLSDAIDAIDGATAAKKAAEDSRKAAAASMAQYELQRKEMEQERDDHIRNVQELKAKAATLLLQLEDERKKHNETMQFNEARSQNQIAKSSETLEALNKEIGLKRLEHDTLHAAIAKLKAIAQDAARL